MSPWPLNNIPEESSKYDTAEDNNYYLCKNKTSGVITNYIAMQRINLYFFKYRHRDYARTDMIS